MDKSLRMIAQKIKPIKRKCKPLKTYNDGLEEAALYHDRKTLEFEKHAGKYDIESVRFEDGYNRNHAAYIRALKEGK